VSSPFAKVESSEEEIEPAKQETSEEKKLMR
jgi:hypothetical protein